MADTTGQLSAKAYSMRERIDTFRRSVAQMKKLVSQVIKHNAAIKKKQEDFAKRFDALSTDEFYRPLEMSFRALGEATRKVEDARDKKLVCGYCGEHLVFSPYAGVLAVCSTWGGARRFNGYS